MLKLLEEKQLYAKTSKCFFGVQELEYLGHIVSHEGVKIHHSKIKTIKEWKIPSSIKHLRGFLGLTGYYRKFVKNYGRHGTFEWLLSNAMGLSSCIKTTPIPFPEASHYTLKVFVKSGIAKTVFDTFSL